MLLCCRLELRPSSRPRRPPFPRTWRPSGDNSRDWWAAWVSTFLPYQGGGGEVAGGIQQSRGNEILLPSPRNIPTHGLQEAGPKRTRRRSPFPRRGAAALGAGPPRPPRPPTPGCAAEPRGGPKGTHLLIRPACSCWLSPGGAVGGRCPSPGRQRPPRRRAPPLSSRPPACRLPGRTGGCRLRAALLPGHSEFVPRWEFKHPQVSSRLLQNRSCWECCLVGTRAWTDKRRDGQADRGRWEEDSKRGIVEDRDGDTKTVFLRCKKEKIPLFPHSCLSVFNFSFYIRHAECGQISTERCSFKERRKTQPRSLSGRWAPRCPNPRAEWETRLLGSLPREQAARSRFPGRAAHRAAKGPRSSLPRDFVLVAAGWVPCNISRSALTGSRGEGNRASLAHLAFPPTPGGV